VKSQGMFIKLFIFEKKIILCALFLSQVGKVNKFLLPSHGYSNIYTVEHVWELGK
jgi:hypothetical protein